MNIRQTLIAIGTAAVMSAGLGTSAKAVELLTNGGFETGNLTGWTLTGNSGFTGVTTFNPHSGTYDYFSGPVGSNGTLTQTFHDVVGALYQASGWARSDGGTVADISVSVGGTAVFSVGPPTVPPFTWIPFNVFFLGHGTDSFQITSRNDPAYNYFDDLSVTGPAAPAVPEASTWAMMLLGFVGVGFVAYRRRSGTSFRFA